MHRRHFLNRCGLTVASALGAPALSWAAVGTDAATSSVPSALLHHLSLYSADVCVLTSKAFAKATGLETDRGTTHLLIRVDDLDQLAQFFASTRFNKLGAVYAIDNTLRFTFKDRPYTVTNALTKDFRRMVRAVGG